MGDYQGDTFFQDLTNLNDLDLGYNFITCIAEIRSLSLKMKSKTRMTHLMTVIMILCFKIFKIT